ncbi:hypothetical protein MKEN_01026600 [Mycena kentingensis (nom. inval.)]|nr:hypothetical protein MKEN_01026600 [Mycena kentingensis (nom. inval.)]
MRGFLGLAIVSRTFLNPVRRCLYGHLSIEGPERFLLLTGQLRFQPHLAKFVKGATLISACQASTTIDWGLPEYKQAAGLDLPRPMSVVAFERFLDACPQLKRVTMHGLDFVWPLSVLDPKDVKLQRIRIRACNRCTEHGCPNELSGGAWLSNILTFPDLVELEVEQLAFRGDQADPVRGMPQTLRSTATELTVCSINPNVVKPASLENLLRAMPRVRELVLDGLHNISPPQMKHLLAIPGPNLTILSINSYRGMRGVPLRLDDTVFTRMRRLEQLALNNVETVPAFLSSLPPTIRTLRLSEAALSAFSYPAFSKWLKTRPFPQPNLKEVSLFGEIRPGPGADKDRIKQLCKDMGIEATIRMGVWDDSGSDGDDDLEGGVLGAL